MLVDLDGDYDQDTLVAKGWKLINDETQEFEIWKTPDGKTFKLDLLEDGKGELTEL